MADAPTETRDTPSQSVAEVHSARAAATRAPPPGAPQSASAASAASAEPPAKRRRRDRRMQLDFLCAPTPRAPAPLAALTLTRADAAAAAALGGLTRRPPPAPVPVNPVHGAATGVATLRGAVHSAFVRLAALFARGPRARAPPRHASPQHALATQCALWDRAVRDAEALAQRRGGRVRPRISAGHAKRLALRFAEITVTLAPGEPFLLSLLLFAATVRCVNAREYGYDSYVLTKFGYEQTATCTPTLAQFARLQLQWFVAAAKSRGIKDSDVWERMERDLVQTYGDYASGGEGYAYKWRDPRRRYSLHFSNERDILYVPDAARGQSISAANSVTATVVTALTASGDMSGALASGVSRAPSLGQSQLLVTPSSTSASVASVPPNAVRSVNYRSALAVAPKLPELAHLAAP